MRKEIEFEESGSKGLVPVIVYYDSNNAVFDRVQVDLQAVINDITEADIQEFAELSKQTLANDLNNIYNGSVDSVNGNSESIFKRHKNNYISLITMKRVFFNIDEFDL